MGFPFAVGGTAALTAPAENTVVAAPGGFFTNGHGMGGLVLLKPERRKGRPGAITAVLGEAGEEFIAEGLMVAVEFAIGSHHDKLRDGIGRGAIKLGQENVVIEVIGIGG